MLPISGVRRKDITMGPTDVERIRNDYLEQLYANKFDIWGELDIFLEGYNLLKLFQE